MSSPSHADSNQVPKTPSTPQDERSPLGENRISRRPLETTASRVLEPRAEAQPTAGPAIQTTEVVGSSGKTRRDTEGKGVTRVKLPPVDDSAPLNQRPDIALALAQEAFTQTGYWVAFYRATLGPEGVVAKLFPDEESFDYFCATPQFLEIQKMLAGLRSTDTEKAEVVEPQRMVTIRIPHSLQQALIGEAKRRSISVNKLCISKMLLPVAPEFVPTEQGRVRGRKPKVNR